MDAAYVDVAPMRSSPARIVSGECFSIRVILQLPTLRAILVGAAGSVKLVPAPGRVPGRWYGSRSNTGDAWMKRYTVEECNALAREKVVDLEKYRELKEWVMEDYRKFGDIIFEDGWCENGVLPF
jgi:hypothetical protein